MPYLPRRVRETAARRTLKRLARSAQRHPRSERPHVSPVVIEEEAASLLYGERSGMVNASPVGPPLEDLPPQQRV